MPAHSTTRRWPPLAIPIAILWLSAACATAQAEPSDPPTVDDLRARADAQQADADRALADTEPLAALVDSAWAKA